MTNDELRKVIFDVIDDAIVSGRMSEIPRAADAVLAAIRAPCLVIGVNARGPMVDKEINRILAICESADELDSCLQNIGLALVRVVTE